ncbi:unnamed protein product, partial [Mesorhabditis belari]|uniref:Uncharacterized protein n=1 Tax=Mesorhabditis belari TaxID=2138241 RepID=A0AAF3J2V0_9BILA
MVPTPKARRSNSSNGTSMPKSPPGLGRTRSSPLNTPNFALGMLIQMARKLLFLDVRQKAMVHIGLVTVFSLFALFFTFTLESSFFGSLAQKESIFNQYGVKIGWFWTLFVVGPFIFYSSKLHHKNAKSIFMDLMRLLVATLMWYMTIQTFHWVREKTSRCDKSLMFSRDKCSEQGGHWIPGMDISGHCFLMLYSILIISEEASAFRSWNKLEVDSDVNTQQFQLDSFVAQCFFVLMMVLHVFWDVQIVISCLYYHFFIDKFLGASFAIICWYFTYGLLYPSGFLTLPINRERRPFRTTY